MSTRPRTHGSPSTSPGPAPSGGQRPAQGRNSRGRQAFGALGIIALAGLPLGLSACGSASQVIGCAQYATQAASLAADISQATQDQDQAKLQELTTRLQSLVDEASKAGCADIGN